MTSQMIALLLILLLMNFIIYGGTLIALLVYVNGESETLNLEMNAEIILNNQQGYLALQQI